MSQSSARTLTGSTKLPRVNPDGLQFIDRGLKCRYHNHWPVIRHNQSPPHAHPKFPYAGVKQPRRTHGPDAQESHLVVCCTVASICLFLCRVFTQHSCVRLRFVAFGHKINFYDRGDNYDRRKITLLKLMLRAHN